MQGQPQGDGQWLPAFDAAALPEGGARGARLGPHRIAVFRREGGLYATDSLCTHAWVPLEDGLLDGFEIECPVHQARFDIRNGECRAFPAERPLRTFPAREHDGRVEVWIPATLEVARAAVRRPGPGPGRGTAR